MSDCCVVCGYHARSDTPWHAKYSWCRCFVLVYDVCTSNPYCGMGTCVSHGVNSYNCLCDAGYTGIVCTEEIDECSSNPCLHGNCTQFIGSYQCSCEYGYEGAECDMPAHSSCERRTIKEAFRAKIETLLINLLHFLYVFGANLLSAFVSKRHMYSRAKFAKRRF